MIGVQVCIVLIFVGLVQCEFNNDWYDLPNDTITYLNCSLSVSGTFNSTEDNQLCRYDYQYRIDVDYNESFIMIQTANIHRIGDYECIVTGSFVITKSHHVIQFRAIPNQGGNHLSHPAINIYGQILSGPTINLKRALICLGEFLHWTPPSVLPNYQISNYNIYIREANITYQTNNTWIFIPYSDLELHRQYEILISASYCAGQGNETSESIVTSIAPQIKTAVHPFTVINSTTASVSFESKVYDVSCEVSFPTSVSINTSCGVHEERNITVNIDGSILIEDVLVPVDQSCNTSLYWNNALSSTNTVVFNTYQLRSCDITSRDDNITYKCSYANQSVLWGCGIEVINIMNGDTNTSNTSDNGVINGLCDGMYNVTCYGIPDPTSSTRIIYNDSKHHSLISITGSDCEVSSSIVEPSFTPTIVPVSTECNVPITYVIIGIILAVVILAVIVFIIISVLLYKRYKGQINFCPRIKTTSGGTSLNSIDSTEDSKQTTKL